MSVAQNMGSINQAVKAATPYNTLYFGIYPQTFFRTVLEAMDHRPTPETPQIPFVVVESDNQVLNGGALSFGKMPRGQASVINVEPLKWQIVKDDPEGILMFTDGNINVVPYNDQMENPTWNGTWRDASVRRLLSNDILSGYSHDSIPPVYRSSLTSYPSSEIGKFNYLIGTIFPHSDLPAPPANSTTAVWHAAGAAVRTDYFTESERKAVVSSLLTNPSFGANQDNINTDDMIFLPAVDVVEAVYPVATTRKSVNTRYVMSYPNTTSAPADDDWITRTHSSAPFPGFITQITRNTGAKDTESTHTKKPIRPALHLDRNRIVMVSQSKPAATSLSFTATTFAPSTTLKLTLVDGTLTPFSVTCTTAPVNGYIPVSGSLALDCNGGTGGTGSYISCLLESEGSIKYYTKATSSTGSATAVNLNFAGVSSGTYTLKVFNEITNTTDKPDYATPPVSFDIYISGDPLVAPVIATVALSNGFEGRAYSDTVKLSTAGSPAPKYAVSSGSLPPGLTLNATTGRISGTLSASSAGSYTFKISVHNPAGSDERQFTITASAIVPPVIATKQSDLISADSVQGYLTIPYIFRFKLQAGTGLPSVKFYKTSGNLPTGFTLDENGTLHGIPVTVETQNFTICAETEGMFDYQSYSISILTTSPTNPILPVFVTKDLGASAQVTENTLFADTAIQITGSQFVDVQYDPTTFPTGITFDPSTRRILGTPLQGTSGTYNLKLWAKNPATKPLLPSGPDSVGITYPLTVLQANIPKITVPATLPPAAVGLLYSVVITTDLPATLAVTGGLLPPPDFMLNASNELAGTPNKAGTYTFTIRASNANGWSNREFTLTVQPPLPPPLINPFILPDGTVGEAYVGATITAINSPTSWSWTGAPPGLTLSSGGVISGIPTADGTWPVSVTATNAWGTSASVTASIVIRQSPLSAPPVFVKALTEGIEGIPYYDKIYVYTRPDIVWTLIGGTLPPGLKFENGIISGTPSNREGRYRITVRATSAGSHFAPVTQELTLWIMSLAEDWRSRKVTLPTVAGAVTRPAPDAYYVKSGSDFVFTITPNGDRKFVPEVTTNRILLDDSTGVIVAANPDSVSYTVTIRDIHEEVYINVVPSANAPVEGVTKVWSVGRCLYIATQEATEVKIYNLIGNLVKYVSVAAGQMELTTLPTGVYLVELNSKAVFKAIIK
jgi:hypothetical protein